MKKWYLLIVLLSLLGFESTVVAQYQQYPPPTSLLSRANTWTGAQTFDDVTINGDCVGCVPTALSGIVTLTWANGGAIRGTTTSGNTWLMQGYDNDTGPGYVTFGTITNGNTPSLAFANPTGGGTITYNKVTITQPATSATLTLTDGKTLSVSNTLTLSGDDASSVAFGAGGTVAYTNVATLSSLTSVGTIGTGVWNGTVVSAVYGGLGVANNVASTLTISGSYASTFTVTGTTTVTFPTTGTLATLAGAEALTNKTLAFTAAPSNQTATGVIVPLTYGESIVLGDLRYVKSDGKVWKADANAIVFPVYGLALATASEGTNNVLRCGVYRDDTRYNFTIGGLVYLSITAGGETQTIPAALNDLDQVVGTALSADVLDFCPSAVYTTHA